jgi:hypothetical protein
MKNKEERFLQRMSSKPTSTPQNINIASPPKKKKTKNKIRVNLQSNE